MMRLFGRRTAKTGKPARSPVNLRGAALLRAAGRALRATFDAAETNDANQRHWTMANGASADAAMSTADRQTLRNRARYECINNSYLRGIVDTLADDCVGTGPRLQLLTGVREIDEAIEREFAAWADAVGLADKLFLMRVARAESGEVFGILAENPELDSRVHLDLRLIEADQVATPTFIQAAGRVDGIEFDEFGNPSRYHVLRAHPGDMLASLEYDAVLAKDVIHYFRPTRPGQSRGVPDITQALPLAAMLRRYTLASLGAAEVAALFAGILYSEAPADPNDAESVEPMEAIPLEARSLLTVPAGHRMEQMRAEQPTTTYGGFKRELVGEMGRCVGMPFNVAAADSSSYNYASGRLDHQGYDTRIRIERKLLERVVLDRLLRAWLDEAVLVSDLLPLRVRSVLAGTRGRLPRHQWFWPSRDHVDPSKEATAQQVRITNRTTTLASEYARVGRDWEAELRQIAAEEALMRELKLIPANAAPAAGGGVPATAPASPAGRDNERDDDDEGGESDAR